MAAMPYGQRHIVALIDERAAASPQRPCLSIANSPTDASLGWRDISYGQFANAVNRATAWLTACLHGRGRNHESVAYVGCNDSRYAIIIFAAIKAGYKMLLISPRNTLEGQLNLFKSAGAVAFLYGDEYEQLMAPVVEAAGIPSHAIPGEREWLDVTPVDPVHVDTSRPVDEMAQDPVLVLHTSGSTGLPKPVVLKMGNFFACDLLQTLESPAFGRKMWMHRYTLINRFFSPLPMFHAGGITQVICFGIYYDFVSVLPLTGRPLTTDAITGAIDHANCDSGVIPPSVLADLSADAIGIAKLEKWRWIITGGGPSASLIADRLRGTSVFIANPLGSTETTPLAGLDTDPHDYPHMRFAEDSVGGFDWRPIDDGSGLDLYELWLTRLPNCRHQGVFYTFPHLDAYNTKDIFRKLDDGLWQYYARSDDIIAFSNGEKLNPVDLEGAVQADPKVKGALVVGQGRFQAAMLVEPVQSPTDEAAERVFIDDCVWPIVDAMNQRTVTHGIVLRNFIRLTDPLRPFPRAGKGTIQRAASNRLYETEIERMYASTLELSHLELRGESQDALASSLVTGLRDMLENTRLDLDTDLFSVGVDSMQVLVISRSIKAALKGLGVTVIPTSITPRAIYAASTPRGLAQVLFEQISLPQTSPSGAPRDDSVQAMRDLVARFTADLPSVDAAVSDPGDACYAIIGTTGSLGPYLLDAVLATHPGRVFALNRDPLAAQHQKEAHVEHGLAADFARVTFLTADLARPAFGLSPDEVSLLSSNTRRFIHSAWPVNFDIALPAFVPSIAGVRNLVDFAAAAPKRPHITFVSTIGTVDGARVNGVIEEAASPLEAAVLPYSQSKAVSSAILDAARAKGLDSAIVRVGQIIGSSTGKGKWNTKEWFPTLVASSASMGVVPSDLGSVRLDWLPVEVVAASIFDVSCARGSGYYHVVNSKVAQYTETVLPAIREYFGNRVTVVGFDEWLVELSKQSQSAQVEADFQRVPAIKLLDFYHSLVAPQSAAVLDTKRAREVSQTLPGADPVQTEWVQRWLQQWAF